MQINGAEIKISVYVSRLKAFAVLLLLGLAAFYMDFDDPAAHSARYRWITEPAAWPVRWFLILGITWLLLLYLWIVINALMGRSFLSISDGQVQIGLFRKVQFPLSSVESINTHSKLKYLLRANGKNYQIPLLLCRDREDVEAYFEYIGQLVSKRNIHRE